MGFSGTHGVFSGTHGELGVIVYLHICAIFVSPVLRDIQSPCVPLNTVVSHSTPGIPLVECMSPDDAARERKQSALVVPTADDAAALVVRRAPAASGAARGEALALGMRNWL